MVLEVDLCERRYWLLQFTAGTSHIPVNDFKEMQGSDGLHALPGTSTRVCVKAYSKIQCSHDRVLPVLQA